MEPHFDRRHSTFDALQSFPAALGMDLPDYETKSEATEWDLAAHACITRGSIWLTGQRFRVESQRERWII